jgi:hypothetical protein
MMRLHSRLNRATFVTHNDQWPMPSCLTTAEQQTSATDEPLVSLRDHSLSVVRLLEHP